MKKQQKNSDPITWYKNSVIDWFTFELHVAHTRQKITGKKNNILSVSVLNLCTDRYHFLVTFTASILEKRTTIMPANQSDGELARLIEKNKGVLIINDADIEGICQTHASDLTHNASKHFSWNINLIKNSMVVAELYTSGSTGTPVAHQKTWGQLINGAQQTITRFNINHSIQTNIIATVPPQHMFGFEMSIILPLACNACIHHKQPFYPLDIQIALNEMPAPRILVTTPTHLNACINADENWPKIDKVISATSPLSETLAHQVESVMHTNVEEIYGCSEIGAIATRRVTQNKVWKLLPDYSLIINGNDSKLLIPTLLDPIPLPDNLELVSDKHFKLLGRATDMVKIGGKRGSLVELTMQLKALHGVIDAIIFEQEQKEGKRERLAALVIAKNISSIQLRQMLSKKIDAVFLPRPLCLVTSLPYTSTGKLPKESLTTCLNSYLKKAAAC